MTVLALALTLTRADPWPLPKPRLSSKQTRNPSRSQATLECRHLYRCCQARVALLPRPPAVIPARWASGTTWLTLL